MSFNQVILLGRLPQDVEMRHMPTNNVAIANFSVVDNRRWKNKESGEEQEETTYVDVTAFGAVGEAIGKHFHKGKEIMVIGRLKLEKWEKDGERRSKLKVICERFEFVGPKEDPAPDQSPGKLEPIEEDQIPF